MKIFNESQCLDLWDFYELNSDQFDVQNPNEDMSCRMISIL